MVTVAMMKPRETFVEESCRSLDTLESWHTQKKKKSLKTSPLNQTALHTIQCHIRKKKKISRHSWSRHSWLWTAKLHCFLDDNLPIR